MEDNNKRIMPTLHPSQAEKISLRAFRSQRGMLGEGSIEIDNLQAETSAQEPLYLQERGRGEVSIEIDNLQAETSNSEKLPLPSPSKGMSEAKVEQQSTETLSFRCWCERCRLTRGRIVKQTQVSELGWGEGSTFNSATTKQLQEPNNKTECRLGVHPNNVDFRRVKRKHVAFTLAEVLITLGIIGVVAALTLPALLTNIQSKVRAERSRSVQYKFSLATEKMARLNLIGPYDSTDAFVDELQKHLKISKRCNASNLRGCWPYDTVDLGNGKTWDISKTKTGKQLGMNNDDDNDYTSDNVGIVTADGTPMILSYNKKCKAIDSLEKLSWTTTDNKPLTNPSASCVAAVYEINGTGKPNKLSDDVVLFHANKLGSGCAFEVGSKCFGAPFAPTSLTRAECEAEKGNLGIKECYPYGDFDYWAGAVKQCGGVSKMPTEDDLAKLASKLYKGNPSIGAYQIIPNLQWDQDAATALGFTSSGFDLWSGEERDSGCSAYYHSFYFTLSRYDSSARNQSSHQAVCIAD